jgi:DnaJ-class molecular chaperone
MSADRPIDFDPRVDFYKALGVDKKASADDIKKAYRKLAKQYHPDTTGGDKSKETRFKEISTAYEVLGDAKKRAQYDELREYGFRGGGNGGPGGFAGQGFGGQGFSGQGQVFDLNDLFGQFFRSQGGRGGHVRVERMDFDDGGGGGWQEARGRGRRARAEAQDAEFQSRVRAADGSWLDVHGVDVQSEVRIPWDRAVLGTVVDVPTVDGSAKVKIPPGTPSGRKLRLRGKGVSDGSRVGDQYVTVQIDVPSGADLPDDTKRELVELATKLRKHKK